MIQIITGPEACAAARKAYKERRLLAQCDLVEAHRISYGYEVDICDTKFVCAIGACLSENSLEAIEDGMHQLTTIDSDLAAFNYIFNCKHVDFDVLVSLQKAHDQWLMFRIEDRAPQSVAAAEQKFLTIIQDVLGDDDG